MAEIVWHTPGKILLVTYSPAPSADAVAQIDSQVATYLTQSSAQRVAVIADIRALDNTRQALHVLLANHPLFAEPNFGFMVILHNDAGLASRGTAFAQIMGVRYRFATDLEQALRLAKTDTQEMRLGMVY